MSGKLIIQKANLITRGSVVSGDRKWVDEDRLLAIRKYSSNKI